MSSDWQSTAPELQRAAEAFLARHSTLHALLVAGGEVLDVVIQDEFTHDVVARLPPSAGAGLVVFDST